MAIKRFALVIATFIGGGMASGCGDASPLTKPDTLSPAAKAKADAQADAVRNVIIQQSSQNTFRPSMPDYGAGFKY